MANIELLDQIIGVIETEPEKWDQSDWGQFSKASGDKPENDNECGTAYCVGGWACVWGGKKLYWEDRGFFSGTYSASYVQREDGMRGETVSVAAQRLLGIDLDSASMLFSPANSLERIKEM